MGGGRGVTALPKGFKKGKIRKHGVFLCIGVIKISFSVVPLTRKYMLLEGFYHNFSTKKASAAPWTPEVPLSPLTIYLTQSHGLDVVVTCPHSNVVKTVLLSATLSFPFYLAFYDTKSYGLLLLLRMCPKYPSFRLMIFPNSYLSVSSSRSMLAFVFFLIPTDVLKAFSSKITFQLP